MLSKLYLHVGHGKTGSSYLQSCLARSQHLLDIKKICYPIGDKERLRASAGYITSGNGFLLLQKNSFDAISKSLYADHNAILFSSEILMKALLDNRGDIWSNISNLKEKLNIKEIDILLFIRNPFDMISSIYQQMVKRQSWYLDMDDYLNHYVEHFKNVLDFLKLIAKCNDISLKVFNYSNVKHQVTNIVENWLQLDEIKLLLPDASIVNRSLTKGEVELQKTLNKFLGNCGALLSDPLCEKLPNIKSDTLTLSPLSKKLFTTKIEPILNEINAMIDPAQNLSMQDLEVSVENADEHFVFSKDQLKVIGESFSTAIAKHRAEINVLKEKRDLLMSSLPFQLSKILNKFPRIKKIIKVFFLKLLSFKNIASTGH